MPSHDGIQHTHSHTNGRKKAMYPGLLQLLSRQIELMRSFFIIFSKVEYAIVEATKKNCTRM